MEWPPDYAGELDRRLKLEHRLTAERELLAGALLQYAQSPADFISDCVLSIRAPATPTRASP